MNKKALVDGFLMALLGASAAWATTFLLPFAIAAGVNLAKSAGGGVKQIGAVIFVLFSPSLPFLAIAVVMYWMIRLRGIDSAKLLLWVALGLAGLLVVPMSSSVFPSLGSDFENLLFLKSHPVGFAIYYFLFSTGAILTVYEKRKQISKA